MKNNLPFAKANMQRNIYLGVCTALMLSGCSLSSIKEPFTGEREVEPVVGARRVPTLNAHTPVPPASKLPPMVTRVAPAESEKPASNPMIMDNPYDQYGAPVLQGNPDAEKNVAPVSNNDDNFFSRLFSLDEPAPAPVPQEVATKPLVTPPAAAPVRKQLIGNPYIPRSSLSVPSTVSTAPVAAAPIAEPHAKHSAKEVTAKETKAAKTVTTKNDVTNIAPSNPEPLPAPAMESAALPEPVTEPVKDVASVPPAAESADAGTSHETLLGRIGSKLDFFNSDSKPEVKSDYPLISSVPAKPEEFSDVKRDEQQNFNELKTDHSTAQREKLSLDREVNGGNAVSTVPLVIANEPAPAAAEQPSAFDSVMSSLSGKSVNDQIAQPLPSPAVDEGDKKDNNQPVSVSDTQKDSGPNFFENLFSSFGESSNPPVASAKVEPAVPVVALDNINVEPPAAKPAEFVGIPAADIQPPSEPAATQSSLPSPDIIKTLPPSRYEARRTQH